MDEKIADLKTLSDEMAKLKKQIEALLDISGYRNFDDLSLLDDYKQIQTADQRQQLEEYRKIPCNPDKIQSLLEQFEKSVREIGTLHKNSHGRYETDKVYYCSSGSEIEFLRTEEVCNYDTDKYVRVRRRRYENYFCSKCKRRSGQDHDRRHAISRTERKGL